MKTVLLSAGHSLSDPGAVFDPGTKEAFLTMELTRLTADILRKHGVGVLTVPDTLNLTDTIKFVNARAKEQRIDLAAEIHTNSSTDRTARGIEAWHYYDFGKNAPSDKSRLLAQMILDGMAVESNLPVRGNFSENTNRWGRLGFVHDTTPLAVLIEAGFISNEKDRSVLLSPEGRFNLAKGIARGILTNLGEPWKPELLRDDISADVENAKDAKIKALEEAIDSIKKHSEWQLAKKEEDCQNRIAAIKQKATELLELCK